MKEDYCETLPTILRNMMKLINKMLMECQPTANRMYMALITVLENGTADMLCCFCDGYGKEIGRDKKNYTDRHEATKVLEELIKQYSDDERPAVVINNIAEVMQRAPA